jgi:hypothetical protein
VAALNALRQQGLNIDAAIRALIKQRHSATAVNRA